jgi:hypothetical protein
MIERGYKPVINALAKMIKGGIGKWVRNLHAVLWADRTTVRKSTGYTPFYLNIGMEAILPIELDIPTWRILPWNSIQTTEDLLAMRARQLLRREDDLEEARLHLQRMREQGKDLWDAEHVMQPTVIEAGHFVLVHDTQREKDVSSNRKLKYRWLGPYKVAEAIHEKGTYILQELDGTRLRGTFAGNRLKPFYPRFELEADERAATPNVQGTNTDLWEDDVGDEDNGNENDDDDEEEEEDREKQLAIPRGQQFAVVIPKRSS